MNLLHMKYAVEIAKTKSINKAAEILYVGQPTLSRAIKELETSLGVTVFERSAKGMFLTPEGEIFIRYAKTVLKQVDAIEDMFSNGKISKKRFSVSVPRASYIADAFAKFTKLIDNTSEIEMMYKETNSMQTINNILQDDYKLGIIRYAEKYDKYYKSMMDEKGLNYEFIAQFRYVVVMNSKSPLASITDISYENLKDYIEIAHNDAYLPNVPFSQIKKEELTEYSTRRIFVSERGSQLELLSQNQQTYMWVSPLPQMLLDRCGLVQRECDENTGIYKDMLIHRKDHVLSDLDKLFIEELVRAKRKTFSTQQQVFMG